jgi:murein DD-endopeptidase MepM/ murein hydrolase activator NlpD
MKLSNPAPGRPVTSPYGWRIHPITKKRAFHRGTDFGGTFDVLAAGDGEIVHIGWSPNGGGHVVIIEHQRDLYTVYYHGAHRTALKLGDRVKTGDLIYRSGSTGSSTGPHLHFEVRTSRAWGTDVPPDDYFKEPQPVKITVDGVMGKQTWSAIQTTLRAQGYYSGRIDGIAGKLTVSGLQKYINDGKF